MADKTKLPILILIVLILISLSLTGGVFFLLQKERAKNLALQEELEDVKTRQKITETKLQESQKLVSNMELKLQEAKTQVDNLTVELQQEKSAKDEAKALIEQLRLDLEQQKGLRQDLEKKLSQAQKDVEKIQAQLKELESRKQELETKIKDLGARSSGVELGKIVVESEVALVKSETAEPVKAEGKSPVSELEGKILVVNKDYNFVVINLGSKDGIDIGNVFSVYHGNKYIGDIKVEKIHDSMSAAGFVVADIKDKILEGDKVIRKTK